MSEKDRENNKHKQPLILAVASGKGGVGKSFVAANLAMAFAAHKKETVLVDLDLGSANAHTCLGINHPTTTLSQLLNQKNIAIDSLVERSETPYIGLISGSSDDLDMANLKHFQKLKIMRNLKHLNADYVILDLGAGTGFNTLDFFLYADQGLLTVMPEPTSVENTYRFVKSLLTRQLRNLPKQSHSLIHDILTEQKKEYGKVQSFATFLAAMLQKHPEHGTNIQESLRNLNVHLIVNQMIDPEDIKLSSGMKIVFYKYFNLNLNVLGSLHHDPHVVQSLKQRQSYYKLFPQSRNAICLHRIAGKLIKNNHLYQQSMEA